MNSTISIIVLSLIIVSFCDAINFKQDATLTPQQKTDLEKFKQIMIKRLPHDYMKKDIYLIRWLRVEVRLSGEVLSGPFELHLTEYRCIEQLAEARNFNLKEAETMLMNNLKWREEQRMDTIHQENWSHYELDYKYSLDGRDKEGKPIFYLDVGSHDLRKAVVSGQTSKYLRFVNKAIDELSILVRDLGEKYRNVSRAQFIYDLHGFNLVEHACLQCVPALLSIVDSYHRYFPQLADQIIFVNTPRVFEPLLNVLRSVSDPETKESVRVYGRNRKIWQQEVAKDFDFDQLPPSLGGTKIDANLDNH